ALRTARLGARDCRRAVHRVPEESPRRADRRSARHAAGCHGRRDAPVLVEHQRRGGRRRGSCRGDLEAGTRSSTGQASGLMAAATLETALTRDAGITVPLICGAMYPCSNPELVAAVSAAGAIGIVQPVSMTYVHRHEFRAGLRYIRSLTSLPIGFNA